MKFAKAGALLATLAATVLALIGNLVFGGPRYVWEVPARTDLPAQAGFRTLWAAAQSGGPAVRVGDHVVEFVHADPTPFAAHYADPLYQAAYLARRGLTAVVITVDNLTGADIAMRLEPEGLAP